MYGSLYDVRMYECTNQSATSRLVVISGAAPGGDAGHCAGQSRDETAARGGPEAWTCRGRDNREGAARRGLGSSYDKPLACGGTLKAQARALRIGVETGGLSN